jgi:anti-sigma regulatory factor (Ser/Thr protein kinase)
MSAASPPDVALGVGFRHEALLYHGDAGLVDAVVPFVRDGLDANDPVLVALTPSKTDRVREALGADADLVTFVDMGVLGQNPARILPTWREFVDRATEQPAPRMRDGRTVVTPRGVGEPIWHGRSDVELIECQRHESLLNVAFEGSAGWWLLCPYDVSVLDDAIVEEARRSHPYLFVSGTHQPSPIVEPDPATAYLDVPLVEPPPLHATVEFGPDDVRLVRDHVAAHVVASGMAADRGFDLLVAASEVATNSLVHGGGHGELRVWHDADTVVCEFADNGVLDDPLAGRESPDLDAEGSRGLWIANQLCDLVQIRVFESGTVVRLHMAVSAA